MKERGRSLTSTIVLQDALPATVRRQLGIVGEVPNAQRRTIVRPIWNVGHEGQDGIQRRRSNIILAEIPGKRWLLSRLLDARSAVAKDRAGEWEMQGSLSPDIDLLLPCGVPGELAAKGEFIVRPGPASVQELPWTALLAAARPWRDRARR